MTHMPECVTRLSGIGVAWEDGFALRRIAMSLHRWYELECGDGNECASWSIVRGHKKNGAFEYDDNGAPYEERHVHTDLHPQYRSLPDRERGAHKRLAKIMAKYPALTFYLQTDPRGAPLYILDKATTPQPYEQFYTRGIAVYK